MAAPTKIAFHRKGTKLDILRKDKVFQHTFHFVYHKNKIFPFDFHQNSVF
jgi:hypothetical protein